MQLNAQIEGGSVAQAARHADAATLATLLQHSRNRTLALLQAYEAALGTNLAVPCSVQVNPPLWELGHIAWFQDHWLARNPERERGVQANPHAPRLPVLRPVADSDTDALYNSSQVPHARRWSLALPNLQTTLAYAQAVLDDTLAQLATLALTEQSDDTLYFYRLVLFHEDMHTEAWVYMAQALGVGAAARFAPCPPPASRAPPLPAQSALPPRLPDIALPPDLHIAAGPWTMGWSGPGFAFDNELGPHTLALEACTIDRRAVTWRQYLPFVQATGAAVPRYLRLTTAGAWECQHFGSWQPLDLDDTAVHLSYFEARAWCHWAGRCLPTEAQWERAALTQPGFEWGTVWEWTASPFAPYPGFVPHPYQDYSVPWFDGRPVLKGASGATSSRVAHPRYRNYFTPERNDLFVGFRSCVINGKST